MRYGIGKHGTVFSTRERGAAVRAEIEATLRQAGPCGQLALDFAGVEIISFSFADEVVGRLLLERATRGLGERAVLVTNANDEVLAAIERSLERRGLVGAYLQGDGVRLVNAPAHLQATLDAARARGEFRTKDLAADLGITVQACNNRLKPLLATGLLVRARGIPRSGGREFVYRVALPPVAPKQEVA